MRRRKSFQCRHPQQQRFHRQLQRTDLRHSSIGAAEKASILAAGDVLRKTGVIPATTDIKQVLKDLIDTRYTTKVNGGR
jgi:sulfonate transport system substrate-binding protein